MENSKAKSSGKATLSQYFQAVDRRLERTGLMPKASFRVRVCDQLIELRFPSADLAAAARQSLSGRICHDEGAPNAVLLYWYENCEAYLPAGESKKSSVWRSQDQTGFMQIGTDMQYLLGSDAARHRFYFARPAPSEIDPAVYGHTLAGLFSRWATATGCMMLHAAAVGVNGRGVLVVGRGGSGKSTFAVSCFHEGLDFVSDDYTLVTASGRLQAMPLYTTVAVNPDMYKKLPRLGQPSAEPSAAWCKGKLQFQVSSADFCQALEIKAIIMPRVEGNDEPSLHLTAQGSAMTQLLHSSMIQLDRGRDTTFMYQMAARLKALPVYEMRMSTDLSKNPAALRDFINENF